MTDSNSKKAQAQNKKVYEKHVGFESRFAAGDYVFVEHPPLEASVADRIAYERYSKLLPHRTRSYRAIRVGPQHAKIDQNGMWNTIWTNPLTKVVKEERPNVEITSD